MKNLALAIMATALFAASCCDPSPVVPSDLCNPDPCLHDGICQKETGKCVCQAGYYDEDDCFVYAPGYLASTELSPASAVTMTVEKPGSYLGATARFQADSSTEDSLILWIDTLEKGKTVYLDGSSVGSTLDQLSGTRIILAPRNNPWAGDSTGFNERPLLKPIIATFQFRATMVCKDSVSGLYEAFPAFSINADGTAVVLDRLSDCSFMNTPPVITGSATQNPDNPDVANVDFSGTCDEGECQTPENLSYQVYDGDGTLVAEWQNTFKGTVPLSGGLNTLKMIVIDSFGAESEKIVEVMNDLCAENTTCSDLHRVCRNTKSSAVCDGCLGGFHELDGSSDCAIDEECLPNSCSAHGACDDTTGTVVCDCNENWDGDVCETCPADSFEDGNGDCVDNPCLPTDPCGDHGNCSPATVTDFTCACDNGWSSLTNCTTCASGFIGTDCHDDPCSPTNPCQNGGTCTAGIGTNYTCECAGNWDGFTCNICRNHWDSNSDCATCPSNYSVASDCKDCADGYTDNPSGNCVKIPSCTVDVDCSGGPVPGYCIANGFNYPGTITPTDATSFSITVTKLSGTGTPGHTTPNQGSISGAVVNYTYSTGSDAFQVDRISVTVYNLGVARICLKDQNLD